MLIEDYLSHAKYVNYRLRILIQIRTSHRERESNMGIKISIKVFLFSQILGIGMLQQGFGIGFTSPTLSELLKLGLLDDTTYPIFVSLFVVGLALGSILSIPGSKYLGRKLVNILSSLPVTFGLLLIAHGTNHGYLLAGRFFHGIGAGMLATVIPVYLGEITPSSARGFLTGFGGVYDVTGVLIVYSVGVFLSFRWLSIVGAAISVFHMFALLLAPESPTWLYSRGLEKRAKRVLEGLRGNEADVLEECSAIQIALDAKREASTSIIYYLKLILVKYRLKALTVGIILALGFVNSGIDILCSYTSQLLGRTNGIDPNIVAIAMPIFSIIAAAIAIALVEPCGRKPLLLTSAIILTLSLASLATYFLLDEYIFGCSMDGRESAIVEENLCNWLIIWPGVSLIVYSCCFQIGWGSVVFIIMGELFPIRLREVGPGILQFALNVHSISTLTAFPYVASAIGNGYTFFILVAVNAVQCLFIVLFLPETKGLKADEIEEIFQENSLLCGLECVSNSYELQD